MEIIPKGAEYVKFIFNEFVNGTPILSISKKLNLLGATTKHGNLIEPRTIKYILSNPLYAGYIKWTLNKSSDNSNVIIKKSNHNPIISEDIFELIQSQLNKQKISYTYKQRPCEEYKHWLSIILKCSNYGSSLVKASQTGFQCSNYAKGKCFVSHYLSIKKAENAVIEEIKENDFDKLKFSNINNNKYDTEISFLKKEINLLNEKILRTKEAFLSGADDISEYIEVKNLISEKIKSLDIQLEYYKKTSQIN